MILRTLGLLLLLTVPAAGLAQSSDCGGLTSVDVSEAKLVYPAIAKAAHVQGLVLLLATLERDGKVSNVNVVSGPQMLRESASGFVRSWLVNPFTGPRACPIAVHYYLDVGEVPSAQLSTLLDPQHVSVHSGLPIVLPQTASSIGQIDLQHYEIRAETPCLCDPAAVIGRKRRFGIF